MRRGIGGDITELQEGLWVDNYWAFYHDCFARVADGSFIFVIAGIVILLETNQNENPKISVQEKKVLT
jgi:hypothetical protein